MPRSQAQVWAWTTVQYRLKSARYEYRRSRPRRTAEPQLRGRVSHLARRAATRRRPRRRDRAHFSRRDTSQRPGPVRRWRARVLVRRDPGRSEGTIPPADLDELTQRSEGHW